ncbi:DUF6851 domain-containing protein [Actinacidiphila paucisporea]|uniref:Vanadium-dependent haloperoxidase n=1 Tax=Actinacidiphila paucisporea TaxID=310782 RepID=A0A1M7Q8B0_9ACTN|nr:hypothetical protein [Actinacidiphila paucisporea]SHN26602.1 hypothetical protein SAMN05216499_13036 [Actinacidiphila paucisporea]
MTAFRRSQDSEFSPRRRSLLLGGLGGVSTAALGTWGLSGTASADEPTGPAAESTSFDFDNGVFIRDLMPGFRPLHDTIAPMDVTVLHRFIHLSTTAWFDATAPYHPTAVGVHSRLGRRPTSEAATNRNKNIAALYAGLRVIEGVEPGRETAFRDLMTEIGLDPDDMSENRTSPIGIGNLAGKAVVAFARQDGMNQLGDLGRRYNGQPYQDYTGYQPVNSAFKLAYPSRWQPLLWTHNRRLGGGAGDLGIFTVQQFATPQMGRVKAHTYKSPSQFRLAPPHHTDVTRAKEYKRSADEVLAASAGLTDELKVKAEFFDNKILGLGLSAAAAAMAHEDELDFDGWVHLMFTNTVALYDALIAAWYQKTVYDAVRPWSAIRHVYGTAKVTAWGGPGKGTVNDIPANEWTSYLNLGDHPDYPSGSSTLYSAQAQAVRRFFDDDKLNLAHTLPAGMSLVEPKITPVRDVELRYTNWTEYVYDGSHSRVWGGVHFLPTVEKSVEFGAQFGDLAYEFVQRQVNGDVAS